MGAWMPEPGMLDRRSAEPLYVQLASSLRAAVRSGSLAAGDQLPSEAMLASGLSVSRNTVRLALRTLIEEGQLQAAKGRGTFVRSYDPVELTWSLWPSGQERQGFVSEVDLFSDQIRAQGRATYLDLTVASEYPSRHVAELLKLDASKDLVVVRRRVRFVDDVPFLLSDSYFSMARVEGTELMEPRPVKDLARALTGRHDQKRFRDEITTRMPTEDEVARLRIAPGTAVASIVRTAYADDEGTDPVRVMITVAPGDRTVLIYETNGL